MAIHVVLSFNEFATIHFPSYGFAGDDVALGLANKTVKSNKKYIELWNFLLQTFCFLLFKAVKKKSREFAVDVTYLMQNFYWDTDRHFELVFASNVQPMSLIIFDL